MDGYAISAQDCSKSDCNRVDTVLQIRTTIAAGNRPPAQPLSAGECDRILTGAPLPPGAMSVIPVESTTRREDGKVVLTAPSHPDANIRQAGEDISAQSVAIKPGTLLEPSHIMPLAALGISQVPVYCQPRAAIITTGNEITRKLGDHLADGQIFDSNHYYSQAALNYLGAEVVDSTHLQDDRDNFCTHLHHLMERDLNLIVSSGAVSAGGEHDFVRAGLEQVGAEIIFHNVAMRPGKPNLFARLPNGTLYFGLPGNPLATAAGLRFLVTPALLAMTQQPAEQAWSSLSRGTHNKKPGFTLALLGQASFDDEHRLNVALPDKQPSFMTSPLLNANCWTLLGAATERITPGEKVDIYPLWPRQSLWPAAATPTTKPA